jgi:CTP synthase
MQCAVIEYARNVCGLSNANSTEFDESTDHPIIDIMYDQKDIENMGGTMRLGKYDCAVQPDTKAYEAYQSTEVEERHRHRYEVNNELRSILSDHGLIFSGINPGRDLVEMVEIPDHPWFVGVQFHPELRSTVQNPQPLFVAFVKASLVHAHNKA